MIQHYEPSRIRFSGFELDLRTGELRKNDRRIRLQDQPTRLLCLLTTHQGELVTRAEIQKVLWGDGVFIEVEHAINTAIRKIREALEDDPEKPTLLETLPRKGYRFIGKVEEVFPADCTEPVKAVPVPLNSPPTPATYLSQDISPEAEPPASISAADKPLDEFTLGVPRNLARLLFLFIQVGYLAMYCAALIYWEGLGESLSATGIEVASVMVPLIITGAMCGIAVRIYLFTAVGWDHPQIGLKFKWLFPGLLVFDALWAASPLLAGRTIGFGVALAGVAGLAYVPFAQRTLMTSLYRDDQALQKPPARQ